MDQALTTQPDLAELNQKIDRLSDQIQFLTEEAERQRRQRQEWEELKGDLTLVMNDVFRLTVQELEEVQQCAQIEDIIHFFKRLLRNTCNLEQMLAQMESVMELWQDLEPLSRDVFLAAMSRLEEMERKGYFGLMRSGLEVADQVVQSLHEDDVQRLGQSADQIADLFRTASQPATVDTLNKLTSALAEDQPEEEAPSLVALLRQLNDPQVRMGLSKALRIVKALSAHGSAVSMQVESAN